MRPFIAAAAAAILLAACQTTPPPDPLKASAQLQPTKGNKTFGEATFEQVGDKVRVAIFVQGLKPGQDHALHIHEVGDCSAPDGMSAKGHFNPDGMPHGHWRRPNRHAGDLPALKADKAGRARIASRSDTDDRISNDRGNFVDVDIITLKPGPANIIGRAVIVHADPDDYKTQPTGNAGARIACGVIQAH